MTTPQNSSSQEKGFFYKKRGLGILLLATAGLAVVIFFILRCFDPTILKVFDPTILTEDNHNTLEDIRNLALIIATVFAWLFSSTGLWLANRARVDREDNLNISRQSLNSGRFQKAVEMINEKRLNARLGGLRILQDLIKENPYEHNDYKLAIADWIRVQYPCNKDKKATDKRDFGLATFILDKDNDKKFTPTQRYVPKDLSGIDLSLINLIGVNFQGTNLTKANLSRANLTKANLTKASLIEASLIEANLTQTNLSRTDLSGASLHGADLTEANLQEADLSGASLHGADLREADLSGADLSGANLFNVKNLTKEQLESARWDKDNRPINVPEDLRPLPHDGKPSSDKEDK